MDYEIVSLGLVGIVAAISGINEIRRVWLFYARQKISFPNYKRNQLERIRIKMGEAAMDKYKMEIEQNWWKRQGIESLVFGIFATLGGLFILAVVIISLI